MKHEELLRKYGRVFLFHPDEKFDSIGHLLKTAKNSLPRQYYLEGVEHVAELMGDYIDGLRDE
jgi:hypothetical protein